MKKEDIRIVFMGTPDFAVPTLDAVIKSGYNVVGVITAPDRKAGRGRKIMMSAVKEYALENKLAVLQPTNLKSEYFYQELSDLAPNLQIVVAFRMLPKKIWSLPKLGTFNLHASLLPQYRGAAPINFALINGETVTGLTTFFLDEEIDTGKIINQIEVDINSDDDAGSLHDKLMNLGGDLVVSTIDDIINDKIILKDQKNIVRDLKTAHKLFKDDCEINWDNDPDTLNNFIRGLSPYPAAFSKLVSKTGNEIAVKIYKVKIISNDQIETKPGTIITDGNSYIRVAVKTGIVEILELQLSGKKRMLTSDFLRGFNNIQDYSFV